MALSNFAIRQAKATGKAYTLPDLDGLCLAVSATGGKAWHFRYYWAGRQKRMSLGSYPEVSLREARVLRDEWIAYEEATISVSRCKGRCDHFDMEVGFGALM